MKSLSGFKVTNNLNIIVPLILFIALLLKFFAFSGMSEGDDLYYSRLAYQASQGAFDANYIFSLRWMVFFPAALLYKIFGVNDFSSLSPSILVSMLNILLLFFIVKKESSNSAALLTVLLYSTFPIVVVYGNFLQVAPFLEFSTLLSIYFVQRGIETENYRWFIFSGVVLSGMYLSRITGLFICPILFLYLLWKKGLNKNSVLYIFIIFIFSFSLFCVQGIVYYFIHNDFLHYIKISKGAVSIQNKMDDVDPKDLFFYIRTLFLQEGYANWTFFGINGWALAGSIIIFITRSFRRQRPGNELLFLLWFLFYFIFMTFIPTNLNPLTFLIRNIRYAIVFIAPMSAFISMMMIIVSRKNKPLKIIMTIVFVILLGSNVFYTLKISKYFQNNRNEQKESVEYVLKNFPDMQIYIADKNIGKRIDYYSSFHNKYRMIGSLKQIKKKGVFLLFGPGHYSKSRFLIPKNRLMKIKRNPPPGLKKLKTLPYFTVYETDPELLSK